MFSICRSKCMSKSSLSHVVSDSLWHTVAFCHFQWCRQEFILVAEWKNILCINPCMICTIILISVTCSGTLGGFQIVEGAVMAQICYLIIQSTIYCQSCHINSLSSPEDVSNNMVVIGLNVILSSKIRCILNFLLLK